jgi:AcrR family transcriptional regulator
MQDSTTYQTIPRFLDTNDFGTASDGLRERKRKALRQQLSDTATGLFLARGFENVRITEIAAACNVSEKTVYNHFPVKESLLLDREEAMTEALRAAITNLSISPINAMVSLLNDEMQIMADALERKKDWLADAAMIQQFFTIIETTPSLRSYQYDVMERLTSVAAVIIATRMGRIVESPEPQIIAEVLIGLWKIQHHALRRYTTGMYTPTEIATLVNAEVQTAAQLVDGGLSTFFVA